MNKDITPLNNKGQQHGLWEYYLIGGQLVYKRFYYNGKRVGYEEYSWAKTYKKKYHL